MTQSQRITIDELLQHINERIAYTAEQLRELRHHGGAGRKPSHYHQLMGAFDELMLLKEIVHGMRYQQMVTGVEPCGP